jgi:hypothetical protein
MLRVWAAENDTREARRAAVYFMLSNSFGVLIDLVGDYDQNEYNAGWPYLYIFADPMLALLKLGCLQCVYAWSRLGTEASVPCLLTFTVVT